MTRTSAVLSVATLAALAAGCGARTALDIQADAAHPEVEVCDGADQDADGRVDEGLAPLRCGMGACAREVPACVDGTLGRCEPGSATREVCNGFDDDCDGGFDEGLALTTLSDPIVLRRPGELTSGPCDRCDEVFGVNVLRTDEGLVVIWQVGYDLMDPGPNTYAVRTDIDGDPIEAPWLWSEVNTRYALAATATTDPSGGMIATCERFSDTWDRPVLFRVGAHGERVGEPIRYAERACGVPEPRIGWTGERLLVIHGGALSAFAADGSLVSSREVPLDDTLFAAPGAALQIGADPLAPDVTMQRLDGRGDPVGSPVVILRDDLRLARGIVALGGTSDWRLLTFRTFDPSRDAERFVAASELPAGAERIGAWRQIARGEGPMRAVAAPGGGALSTFLDPERGVYVLALIDASGAIARQWEVGHPRAEDVVLRDVGGRYAIAYPFDVPSARHNELHLRILSCEP